MSDVAIWAAQDAAKYAASYVTCATAATAGLAAKYATAAARACDHAAAARATRAAELAWQADLLARMLEP